MRWFAVLCLCLSGSLAAETYDSNAFRARLPQDEVIYFLLPDRFENGDPKNDRGGLQGDRVKTGFDPTHKGFYHGGDLRGLIKRLDYIQGLGATAIWLGPIYKNKPVQGPPGQQTAGYHGYWITDFTRVDEHFGTQQDLRELIDTAHARGMKVYLDIITNHTADVISYRQCPDSDCVYRSRADYPYSRAGGTDGSAINEGFLGDSVQTESNFAKLTRSDYAYAPFVRPEEVQVKVPEWLNDPIWYHNRGNTTFRGENSMMGDFVGLDDLMTENPRVLQGFIEIYRHWIEEFGVDGFRIDTARHVNPEFWQAFVPAMLKTAHARGISNFHIFGEVFGETGDVTPLALSTRVDGLPGALDFAFRATVLDTLTKGVGTDRFAALFKGDALYEGGEDAALQLPTFVSNHDIGRFGHYARANRPGESDAVILQRSLLAHAMMFTLRGVPVVYAGDEQGFAGDGSDQDAREDMFPSRVASYNDNVLLGTKATTAVSNFDRSHPLYVAIAELSALRKEHAALRRGKQIVRNYSEQPGLFAVSRIDPQSEREILVAFNTSTQRLEVNVEVDARTRAFRSLKGSCAPRPTAPGSYRVTLEPLSYMVCAAQDET
ncbi:alpha-amylase family glycosyl hydrolase [Steroidobacter cummioxidans]|uniref:alpha-amylase family glycosyl hydrolase n=1 Tax=Steroidobacter cummioxidans TaxID=1803913 RepID=UPI000E310D01